LADFLNRSVAADTAFRLIRRERRNPSRELNRELIRWMLDRRVLMEDNLIIRARKNGLPPGGGPIR